MRSNEEVDFLTKQVGFIVKGESGRYILNILIKITIKDTIEVFLGIRIYFAGPKKVSKLFQKFWSLPEYYISISSLI
jgi:hypothetical protein